MTDLAALLSGTGQTALLAAFIVFLRVGGAMAVFPLFGEATIPTRVRLALAIAFTLVVAPATADKVAPLAARGHIIGSFMLAEPAIGLAFGLVSRLMFMALSMCGAIIAQTTTLAQMFTFAGAEPSPAVSQVLAVAGLALAAVAGLHIRLAEGLIASYTLLPPGSLPNATVLNGWAMSHIAAAVNLSFGLAMPFLIASTLYSLATGVINRALPQLMVSMIGAPAQVLGALMLLAVGIPVILDVWQGHLATALSDPFGAMP